MTPNVMKAMAHAPAVLSGCLAFNQALARGVLDRKFREQIAIAIAQSNA